MNTDFPRSENKFLKAEMFQDKEVMVTYLGWDRKANEDRTFKGKTVSWRETLKFCLGYTYPQMAINKETGEQRLGKDDKPFQNKYWHPDFPQGYSIVYHFEEGNLESGSLPLWEEFMFKRPNPGEVILLGKKGLAMETRWNINRVNQSSINQKNQEPVIQLEREEDIPF